jgi:ABC-2 type transport system permease protein
LTTALTQELVGLHTRELLRDRKYFVFALLFPFGMVGIFLGIGAILPSEPGGPDFSAIVLPMGIFLAVTSAALTATAGPLAVLRQQGTLRLLGTTPVSRASFLLTHLIPRVAMATVQVLGVIALALAIGAVSLERVPALVGVSFLGLTLYLAVGYLIGGVMGSGDAATNVGTLVQILGLFLSGLALPFALMPDAVVKVLSLLPSTFFADMITMQLSDAAPLHPLWLDVLVVLGTAGILALVAVRTFRWDQGE